MTNVKDKIALVTGSTSGIGLSIAHLLANRGARVIFHSNRSVDRGRDLAKQYDGADYIQANLANIADVNAMVDKVAQEYGGVDLLVNNASFSTPIAHSDFDAATVEHWHEMYQINVISPFILTTGVYSKSVKSRLTSVLNISSHAGVFAKGASIPYAVSKSALNHLTKLLAKTMGPDVRINAVAPGLIDTPLTSNWDEIRDQWKKNSVLKRSGNSDELAEFALGLMMANNITGQVIVYDGGYNL